MMPIHVQYDYTAQSQPKWESILVDLEDGSESFSFSETKDSDLASILECPVCFAIPDAEIFNCEKGHSICGQCKKKLTMCVLCGCQYTQARNFMMESVISYLAKSNKNKPSLDPSLMRVECLYKDDGCDKLLLPSELEGHEVECDFRPVKCIVESSSQCSPKPNLKFSKYLQHLKDHHQIRGLSEESGMFTKVDRLFTDWNISVTWPPHYLQYDGKTFLRCATIKNRTVSYWIQVIGHDGDADKYQAKISLSSPSKKIMKISWTVPVHSIRQTKHHIEHSRGWASLSTNRIVAYRTKNEEFGDRTATHTWACKIVLSRVE